MKELEILFKSMADGMRLMADGINSIAEQLNNIAKAQARAKTQPRPAEAQTEKKPAPEKPAAAKKSAAAPSKGQTATEAVLEVIKSADDGMDNKTIGEKTGFSAKKVANAVYRLKREGKIEPVSRGIYKAAA